MTEQSFAADSAGLTPEAARTVTDYVTLVRRYLLDLQASLVASIADVAGETPDAFIGEPLDTPGGGLAQPRVLAQPWDGSGNQRGVEKAAVQFTHSVGTALPPAATERNPALAGKPFQALAVSVIVHPHNPYVPTTHMNVRFFAVEAEKPVWYFGGGFDLTPYYGFEEDARHWHQTAYAAVGDHYAQMKARCDEYFFLGHRNEARGIGGIFFDDWTEGGFAAAFSLMRRVGDGLALAYLPIFKRRNPMNYSTREREFQCYRRGRYAEFNLAIDRGTRYGLQSGRRVESVLASLPPEAHWRYDYRPEPDSPEAALYTDFLPPRDWLATVDNSGD